MANDNEEEGEGIPWSDEERERFVRVMDEG